METVDFIARGAWWSNTRSIRYYIIV